MKVLYVLRYFPTLTETFVYREMDAVQALGVEVSAVAIGSRADGVLQDEPPTAPVVHPPRGWRAASLVLPAARTARHPAWRWLRERARLKDGARAAWLAHHARRLGVERLHAHFAGEGCEWARVAASVVGLPYGVTVHAVDLFRPRPTLPQLLRDANPVVTVAEHHRNLIASRYGVEARVVRCGVDPARYAPARPDDPGGLRVVAVGRWVEKKGLDLLARAVEELDLPAHLRLISDAPARLSSERVQPGPLPPSRVPAALARAHLFALPCRVADDGDRDGIPVALLEAMAAGLPVLTTAISGVPEVVDEEVGWLIPPDDPEALRSALHEAATRPEERARRGRAARKRIVERGLTVEHQARELVRWWAA